MKKRLLLVSVVLAYTAMSAQAASFDCGNARTDVEKMICADAELSKLDEQLAQEYKSAMEITIDKESLRKDQKVWLKDRNKCEFRNCLDQEYSIRVGNLRLLATNQKYKTIADTIPKDGYAFPEYTRIENVKKPLRFKLTFGDSYPVCKEYVDMLNAVNYNEYPACERKILPQFPSFKAVEWVEMKDKKEMLAVMEYLVNLSHASHGRLNHAFHKRDWKNTKEGIEEGRYKIFKASINVDKDNMLEAVYKLTGKFKDSWKYNSCDIATGFYVDDSDITLGNAKEYLEKGYWLTLDNADLFYKDNQVYQSSWNMQRNDNHYFIEIYTASATAVCGINLELNQEF